ncbi:unnamed protein product [Protopolystoma xenopodis]|uniref:Uncharacterized protein n=1 Tax=Protopolystoma xenopodis TaxID=117903 RepID=A0A448XJD0_9PLAT|nr:unnamed protein product [Protopolystoma xenopodis]
MLFLLRQAKYGVVVGHGDDEESLVFEDVRGRKDEEEELEEYETEEDFDDDDDNDEDEDGSQMEANGNVDSSSISTMDLARKRASI